MTPVLGSSCCHTKHKECYMILEERKLILVIWYKSRLQALQISDVTLIFMRPFSHNQRCKQHQKLVYYVPTGLVAKPHSWIRVVDLHGRVALFVGRVAEGRGRGSVRIWHGLCFRHEEWAAQLNISTIERGSWADGTDMHARYTAALAEIPFRTVVTGFKVTWN